MTRTSTTKPRARLREGLPPRVKRTGRRMAVAAGKLTSGRRMQPSFLIVGAQRAGTTSLHRALIQHPAVLAPVLHKGVHYFDVAYPKGMRWYRAHFPLESAARRVGSETGTQAVTGESSPYYMFHPDAPARFARDLPGVRVISLLRDPVERAYSQYVHERARGFETAETFEDALAMEEERLAGEHERLLADPAYTSFNHQHHSYVARGRYAEQLDALVAAVGKDRMLVLDSDAFFVRPEKPFGEVLSFLGLPPAADVAFGQHNARPRSEMADRTRTRLSDYFAPHDERLSSFLGDLPSWRR